MTDTEAAAPTWQQAIRDRCFHPQGDFEPFPRTALHGSIIDRFETIAARFPENIAIQSATSVYTYRALDARANQIAATIIEHRPGCTKPVALIFRHDADLIAAMLAVLKAGRPYVVLQGDDPVPRCAHVLKHCGVTVILTDAGHQHYASAVLAPALSEPVTHLDVSHMTSSHPVMRQKSAAIAVATDATAQIIYTSGSTGQPKGCMQTHRTILHDTYQYTNAVHYCPADRLLLVSVCSFSDSIRTIYGALLNGATLLPYDIKTQGLHNLRSWINDQKITVYRSVPTLFRQFVSTFSSGNMPSIRLLILSGEPVYRSDVVAYKKHFSDNCIMLNRLGTSEAFTFRFFFIDKKTACDENSVPAGYPTPDKDVVLIDHDGAPVRDGDIGQIVVRSRFLSPGYLSEPELNKKMFPPDLAAGGARSFMTGDLGRLLEDGCLVHLGRMDAQVKVHGYRVELAEIEAALTSHAGIDQAAVKAFADGENKVRLAAYCRSNTPLKTSARDIRRFLRSRLPAYMIPKHIQLMAELPLTRTGKLDRQALPEPDWFAAPEVPVRVMPRSDSEKKLASIWSEVLKVPVVGIYDDFFDIGGDSIDAMQMISRVARSFDTNICLDALLECSNISQLARLLDHGLLATAKQM